MGLYFQGNLGLIVDERRFMVPCHSPRNPHFFQRVTPIVCDMLRRFPDHPAGIRVFNLEECARLERQAYGSVMHPPLPRLLFRGADYGPGPG